MRRSISAVSIAAMLLGALPLAALAAPGGSPEPTYFDGHLVYMSAPANALGSSLAHSTAVLQKAKDLYIAVYPVAADGFDAGHKLIDGWYAPQCDPCFHSGVPDPDLAQFHDHIIDGAPGYGTNGTAGSYSPAWRVKVLVYNLDYIAAHAATWVPVKSDEDIDAAVASGEFLGPPIDTGIVFLCQVTSAHAR